MSVRSLLPPVSTTPLMRHLEQVRAMEPRLAESIAALPRAKWREDAALWLIWELGLEELLPYLPDRSRLLSEGLQFQRRRGTPWALRTALGWIGWTPETIEEEGPGERFARYQLELDRVPDGTDPVDAIMAVARLAAPVRSRLFRLYHGLDWRPFVLGTSHLGGQWLLGDCSGARYLSPDGLVQLSFGRQTGLAADIDPPVAVAMAVERHHGMAGRYVRNGALGVTHLGQSWHLPAPAIQHGRQVTVAAEADPPRPSLGLIHAIARADFILGRDVLGTLNGRLGHWRHTPVRGVFVLGRDALGTRTQDVGDVWITQATRQVTDLGAAATDPPTVAAMVERHHGMAGRYVRSGALGVTRLGQSWHLPAPAMQHGQQVTVAVEADPPRPSLGLVHAIARSDFILGRDRLGTLNGRLGPWRHTTVRGAFVLGRDALGTRTQDADDVWITQAARQVTDIGLAAELAPQTGVGAAGHVAVIAAAADPAAEAVSGTSATIGIGAAIPARWPVTTWPAVRWRDADILCGVS